MESSGYYTGIYANVYWFSQLLDRERLVSYDKWLAHWAEVPAYDESFGGMWQYSSTGKVNGIKGAVDLNRMYRNYPVIIKNAGLNGFKKAVSYTVTACINTGSATTAQKIADACRKLGMTVEFTK